MQYDICMSEGGDLIQIVSRRPDRRQDHMEARQDARGPKICSDQNVKCTNCWSSSED